MDRLLSLTALLYRAARPLLFRLDAERAHALVLRSLGLCEALARRVDGIRPDTYPALAQTLWNLDFANPVGLAAGFDKAARLPHVWPLFGFGFAELGTVTALPQPGNPRPRLFRLPQDGALINRLGFNNPGADSVARDLGRSLAHRRAVIPLGINIGKSRATPPEGIVADYLQSLRTLFPFAAYIVVNVSSPNTPGLRDLQGKNALDALLTAVVRENEGLALAHRQSPRPLLVKVAPDLEDEALAAIARVTRDSGAHGLVATNTTTSRQGLTARIDEDGGLSGAPLRARATAAIRTLRRAVGTELPIIGVGGIFTAADAYAKIRAGASLVQLYSGLIFQGPGVARDICHGLVECVRRDGLAHLRDAVGADA